MEIEKIQIEKIKIQEAIEKLISEFEEKTNTIVSEINFKPTEMHEVRIESSEQPIERFSTKPQFRIKVSI